MSKPRICFMVLAWLVTAADTMAGDQPNIVLLLADDLGYTDLGSYGSEIATPHLDALSARGIRFANHHTAASCAPTRAMLMTGVTSHQAGLGNMPESLPADQLGKPGYEGVLRRDVVTIAERLKASGYHTYMTGKWHLGKTPDTLPSARGFEKTLIMADTGADNWQQRPYLPIYSKANWYANGRETGLPEDFYSSRYLVDKIMEFIGADQRDQRPFFAYVAFQAVHIPVQAPREFTEKYLHTYERGWHDLRQRRYEGAVRQGIVRAGLPLVEMATTADWDSLDADRKRYESKTMAVYAGMIEAMDHHIGRLVDYLDQAGELDDTVFIFMSDNGAEPTDTLDPSRPALSRGYFNWWLDASGYNTDYETLGEKNSYNMIGPSFASAAVSPLSYYKFFSGEGGMRVPLIISGPDVPPAGRVIDAFTYVTDLVPTMLSLAGIVDDGEALHGKNLLPLMQGEISQLRSEDEPVGFELGGNAALFQGDYKIVKNLGPLGDGAWHLYNIRNDPAESRDLAAVEPGRLAAMLQAYRRFEDQYGVLPVPEGYDQRRQVLINAIKERGKIPLIILLLLIAAGVFVLLRLRGSASGN